MATATTESLSALYTEDETAWLEEMAALVRRRDLAGLDLDNLAEYLTDIARRDRREVKSRLVVLLMHLLKWEFQPEARLGSWRGSIITQHGELVDCASRGVLRNHAESVLQAAYDRAATVAAAETGLPRTSFPASCPYTIERLYKMELSGDEGS